MCVENLEIYFYYFCFNQLPFKEIEKIGRKACVISHSWCSHSFVWISVSTCSILLPKGFLPFLGVQACLGYNSLHFCLSYKVFICHDFQRIACWVWASQFHYLKDI